MFRLCYWSTTVSRNACEVAYMLLEVKLFAEAILKLFAEALK
jgi:hypothetical protein